MILTIGYRGPMRITCGVPQDSVLGPTPWNVFYDDDQDTGSRVLKMNSYVDDLAMVINGKSAEEISEQTTTAVAQGVAVVMMIGRRVMSCTLPLWQMSWSVH